MSPSDPRPSDASAALDRGGRSPLTGAPAGSRTEPPPSADRTARPTRFLPACLRAQASLDRLALAASGVCALHCLLAPLLFAILPLATTLATNEPFHHGLVAFVLPSSALALGLGCTRHRDPSVMTMGGAGLAALVLVSWLGHRLLGELGEFAAMVGASGVLAAAHARNHRLCLPRDCDRRASHVGLPFTERAGERAVDLRRVYRRRPGEIGECERFP